MKALFLSHVLATLLVTGMMWFLQIVHYPLLQLVGHDASASYEKAHTRLAIALVVSLMVFESATGTLLLWWRPEGVTSLQVWLGLLLLGVIWLSTFVLQVPQHQSLASGFDAKAHRKLVETNWIRTACYTLRACLMLWMLLVVMK